jgi:ubiquinone biosynthesis protein
LSIEGLGRQLDPELDLWVTAKPYLERWMKEQIGWRGLVRHVRDEAPYWSALVPQIPRLVHAFLSEKQNDRLPHYMRQLMVETRQQTALLAVMAAALVGIAAMLLYRIS